MIVLLSETQVVTRMAALATNPGTPDTDLLAATPTLLHSVGGLAVLLVIQVLNVYKPQGVTPYGWRKQQEERRRLAQQSSVALPIRIYEGSDPQDSRSV